MRGDPRSSRFKRRARGLVNDPSLVRGTGAGGQGGTDSNGKLGVGTGYGEGWSRGVGGTVQQPRAERNWKKDGF